MIRTRRQFIFFPKIKARGFSLPLLFLMVWVSLEQIHAQPVGRGKLLVGMLEGHYPEALQERLAGDGRFNGWVLGPKVSNMLNVWLWENPDSCASGPVLLDWMREQPEVAAAQYDHIIRLRSSPPLAWPDDPLAGLQWQYENNGQLGGVPGVDLNAGDAWAITSGGLSPAGDTIVVAIIDGGIDADHPDLSTNLWRNRLEVPEDGLDNDGNGYVDDYRGWNVYAGNDDISGLFAWHGTPVAGVIGAEGNNGVGVAGVNWSVKTMFVAGKGQESVLLAAFDYIWNARRRYNLSGGAEGAFVVTLNCSWGVDYGQASDAPLWCAAFDAMGAEGILSVGATANEPVDVDIVGDLPTTCPSDYLISVTSLNNKNLKADNAAWGATHIDIGAFGEEIYTTASGGSYGYRSGTSFAAPHVAGAIALLYAAPCPNLIALSSNSPAAAAIWVRNLLLENTAGAPSLAGITQSGGRLDLFQLLNAYEEQCADCPTPYAIHVVQAGTNHAVLDWVSFDTNATVNLKWRVAGATAWNFIPGVSPPFNLTGLVSCAAYELSLRANCGLPGTSTWSSPITVFTDGCCAPPHSIRVEEISEESVQVNWSPVTAAAGYRFRIRPSGGAWTSYNLQDSLVSIPGLLDCTDYEVQIQTQCDTGSTDWSAPVFFMTLGCGACLDMDYCDAGASQSFEEWIEQIGLGVWSHSSAGGSGYQDFTSATNAPHLEPGASYPVWIEPGFSGWAYKQFFRLFVDYNADGDFEDAGELAFDPGYATDAPVAGTVTIPATATFGLTRMRVMMEYKGLFNGPPEPCESFEHGQVKDYCVRIGSGGVSSPALSTLAKAMTIFPQPASDVVQIRLPAEASGPLKLIVRDLSGRQVLEQGDFYPLKAPIRIETGTLPQGIYWIALTNGHQEWISRLLIQR